MLLLFFYLLVYMYLIAEEVEAEGAVVEEVPVVGVVV